MRVTHWLLLAIVAAVTAEDRALRQLEETLVALVPHGNSRQLVPGDLFEEHAARYLLAAADASKEVVALFNLYKKLYPERVAAYGSTEATQLAYFEEHVFPRIQEKADELLETSKDGTSTGSKEESTDSTAQTSGGTAGTNGGTSTGGATPSGTNEAGGTTSGGPASSNGVGTGGPTSGEASTSGGTPASRTPSGGTPSGGTPSGTPSSGTPSSGTPSGGTPSSGTPSSGTPTSGTPTSGTPTSGTPTSGTPTSGTPTSGTPTSGTPTSGTPTSDTPTSGTPTSGTPTSGTPTSGTPSSTTPTSGTPSGGTSTSGTSTSSTPTGGTSTSTSLTATSVSPSTTTSSGSSFWSTTYNPTLSANVNSLQSQTNNVETVVQSSSSSSSSSSTPTSAYTSPTVIKGYTSPSRRRFLSTTTSTVDTANVDVLFCDVEGNAIWKWSAEEVPDATVANLSNTTTAINVDVDGVCSATTTLTVSAYQTGCSLQNHPEGCENVYYKGCGGITVSPTSERIVIARTGGRTLGVLNYKHVDEACQGQVVDAIATYRGKKFNSPTYAEYAANGILYFTDSPFGLATSAADFDGDTLDKSPLRELPYNGVYMLPTGTNQSVELVDCTMTRPNKIAFAPANDVMYITNSQKHNSYVKRYELASDGTVRNTSIFFNFTAHPELETDEGYAKGIQVDANGYVYVVCYKGVYIFSPDAEMAGAIMSSEELDSVSMGLGRLFLSGSFGLVAQTSGVPSQPLPQAHVTCQA